MKINRYPIFTCLILLFALLITISLSAQNENIITGRIFPAGMETPMRNVKVQLEGVDSISTITDNSGSFSIEVDSFPVNLLFSKETYQTQVKKVKKATDLSVYMLAGKKNK